MSEEIVSMVHVTASKRKEMLLQADSILQAIHSHPANTDVFIRHISKRVESVRRKGADLTSRMLGPQNDKFWSRITVYIQEEIHNKQVLDSILAELKDALNLIQKEY